MVLSATAETEERVMGALEELEIEVSTRGKITERERAYAVEKFTAIARLAPDRLLHARLRLVMEPDPARERPAIVQGALDLDGRVARAHVAAPTMREAADRFEERLRDRLNEVVQRPQTMQLRHRDASTGEWRHGDATSHRPECFDRPVDERELIVRKEFAVEAETPDEAVFDMESLDHDFFLFTELDSGEDNVVHRAADGCYEIIQPTPKPEKLAQCAVPIRPSPIVSPRLRVDEAVELLNLGDEKFVFFLDAGTGRGTVVYRRHDGHYGLIRPAAS